MQVAQQMRKELGVYEPAQGAASSDSPKSRLTPLLPQRIRY